MFTNLNNSLLLLLLINTILLSQQRDETSLLPPVFESYETHEMSPRPGSPNDNWGELDQEIPWDYPSNSDGMTDSLSSSYRAARDLQLSDEAKEYRRIQDLANPTSSQQVINSIITSISDDSLEVEDTTSDDIHTSTIVNIIQSKDSLPEQNSVTAPIPDTFVTTVQPIVKPKRRDRPDRNCVFFASIYYSRPFCTQRGDLIDDITQGGATIENVEDIINFGIKTQLELHKYFAVSLSVEKYNAGSNKKGLQYIDTNDTTSYNKYTHIESINIPIEIYFGKFDNTKVPLHPYVTVGLSPSFTVSAKDEDLIERYGGLSPFFSPYYDSNPDMLDRTYYPMGYASDLELQFDDLYRKTNLYFSTGAGVRWDFGRVLGLEIRYRYEISLFTFERMSEELEKKIEEVSGSPVDYPTSRFRNMLIDVALTFGIF